MKLQIIISLITFSIFAGITPGPANIASLAASLQYGKKAALKQYCGIACGFFTDYIISGIIVFFIGLAFNKYIYLLSFVGCIYLVYLGIKMIFATYNVKSVNVSEPSFVTGYLLQLTNVKVLFTCLTGLSSYVLPLTNNLFLLYLFGAPILLGPICNLPWLFCGVLLQKLFSKHAKIINLIMAISLFICAISLALFYFQH